MKTVRLEVKGMHCRSCEMLIKDALEEQAGVKSAELSHKDGIARIEYDESATDEEQLKGIIRKEGYEV